MVPLVFFECAVSSIEQKRSQLFGYAINVTHLFPKNRPICMLGISLDLNSLSLAPYAFYQDEHRKLKTVEFPKSKEFSCAGLFAAIPQFCQEMTHVLLETSISRFSFFGERSRGETKSRLEAASTDVVSNVATFPEVHRRLYKVFDYSYRDGDVELKARRRAKLYIQKSLISGSQVEFTLYNARRDVVAQVISYPFIRGTQIATRLAHLLQFLKQLHKLHTTHGVIHGDIRLANILFSGRRSHRHSD